MKKTYENKVMETDKISTKRVKKTAHKRKFSFPFKKRVIEAETLADARELLKNETNE